MKSHTTLADLPDTDRFVSRHNGPRPSDVAAMLETLGYRSLDSLVEAIVPKDIRFQGSLDLLPAESEERVLKIAREMADQNIVAKSHIGMGYYDCITPPVILRNVFENPGWYTAYTPYQPEIAQGRLEALLNFQTVVSDLTGLEIANASLLDEATAVAEAMTLCVRVSKKKSAKTFLLDDRCHPQTIAVVETRAAALGLTVTVASVQDFQFGDDVCGIVLQYPNTDGAIMDHRDVCARAHADNVLVTVATDLLSLVMLTPPGEWGADIALGNSQRFGVPMGYGGPHAAFFATRDEFKRHVPGRIIGVSKDVSGKMALRMALQTREQHIRREKATSNICTAQVLLAVIAGLYAVYHGPDGLRRIAERVHLLTRLLGTGLQRLGFTLGSETFFDTVTVLTGARTSAILERAYQRAVNLRPLSDDTIGIAIDETTGPDDVATLLEIFAEKQVGFAVADLTSDNSAIPSSLRRDTSFLDHPVFHRHRSETEMLRYLKRLEDRDLSLTSAMIPLGSCTMKLNATTEMIPVTWPGFGGMHPFAPVNQARGYRRMFDELEHALEEITGFAKVSLQPNAGSQGEFAGLLVIRAYHQARGDANRTTCLIPQSAHGTNPASAVMAGMNVVVVKTDDQGNIDVDDLRTKAKKFEKSLGALMVTYPSTHGVYESAIREICQIVHNHRGQVYMDGANMNAQVGLCRPGDFGADVCHLNLHKTFCIPHGGGGPGMGPIGVAPHLAPHLPDHPVVNLHIEDSCGTVSAAPWGSSSILPISWAYIRLMGPDGLTDATKISILNANYVARRLKGHYDLLYAGREGLIAHECILDTRPFKASADVSVEDIAKRLIDYGFHPPTISFPVAGTMMVEPTESESKEELDRFCDAMIAIREEIREVEEGRAVSGDNLLTNAPHTLEVAVSDSWDRSYSRERALFPTKQSREHKIWPFVGRIDAAFGDRHLVCACPPIEEYETVEVV